MNEPAGPPVTALLARASAGEAAAREELLALIYGELHALARGEMRKERADHTLAPTVLVHEAWMQLVERSAGADGSDVQWQSRAQFFALAATAMRHVLVDHARRRAAQKRGGNATRVELDEALASYEERAIDVLALDEALERLAAKDAELGRIVELRFFAGLTVEETGRALNLTVRQVEGAWVTARGWLRRELSAP